MVYASLSSALNTAPPGQHLTNCWQSEPWLFYLHAAPSDSSFLSNLQVSLRLGLRLDTRICKALPAWKFLMTSAKSRSPSTPVFAKIASLGTPYWRLIHHKAPQGPLKPFSSMKSAWFAKQSQSQLWPVAEARSSGNNGQHRKSRSPTSGPSSLTVELILTNRWHHIGSTLQTQATMLSNYS